MPTVLGIILIIILILIRNFARDTIKENRDKHD